MRVEQLSDDVTLYCGDCREIHSPFFDTARRRIADELKRPRLALDPPSVQAEQEALSL